MNKARLPHIANVMTFVLEYDAFRANVNLIILAKEFCALVRMLKAVLFSRLLLLLLFELFPLGCDVSFTI